MGAESGSPVAWSNYARLIGSILAATSDFTAISESARSVQVERGLIFPLHLCGRLLLSPVDRLVELASERQVANTQVIDRAGNRRPGYRGLMVYAWLRVLELSHDVLTKQRAQEWREALEVWCEPLVAVASALPQSDNGVPAARGDAAADAAWAALALHVAANLLEHDEWRERAEGVFGALMHHQQDSGAFLRATASDNLETTGYHELVILHAAASYAAGAHDAATSRAIANAAQYHQRETQPDHSTTQPWALYAFLSNQATRPLAEQMLHAVAMHDASSLDGVSLILLADALYCLKLNEPEASRKS